MRPRLTLNFLGFLLFVLSVPAKLEGNFNRQLPAMPPYRSNNPMGSVPPRDLPPPGAPPRLRPASIPFPRVQQPPLQQRGRGWNVAPSAPGSAAEVRMPDPRMVPATLEFGRYPGAGPLAEYKWGPPPDGLDDSSTGGGPLPTTPQIIMDPQLAAMLASGAGSFGRTDPAPRRFWTKTLVAPEPDLNDFSLGKEEDPLTVLVSEMFRGKGNKEAAKEGGALERIMGLHQLAKEKEAEKELHEGALERMMGLLGLHLAKEKEAEKEKELLERIMGPMVEAIKNSVQRVSDTMAQFTKNLKRTVQEALSEHDRTEERGTTWELSGGGPFPRRGGRGWYPPATSMTDMTTSPSGFANLVSEPESTSSPPAANSPSADSAPPDVGEAVLGSSFPPEDSTDFDVDGLGSAARYDGLGGAGREQTSSVQTSKRGSGSGRRAGVRGTTGGLLVDDSVVNRFLCCCTWTNALLGGTKRVMCWGGGSSTKGAMCCC